MSEEYHWVTEEAICRLVHAGDESTDPFAHCPSCHSEFADGYEYAGHEVELGPDHYGRERIATVCCGIDKRLTAYLRRRRPRLEPEGGRG